MNYWRCCAFLKRQDSARRRGDVAHLPAAFSALQSPPRGLLPPQDQSYSLRRHGEILEQLGGRQSVLRSRPLIAEAYRLYASRLTGSRARSYWAVVGAVSAALPSYSGSSI